MTGPLSRLSGEDSESLQCCGGGSSLQGRQEDRTAPRCRISGRLLGSAEHRLHDNAVAAGGTGRDGGDLGGGVLGGRHVDGFGGLLKNRKNS